MEPHCTTIELSGKIREKSVEQGKPGSEMFQPKWKKGIQMARCGQIGTKKNQIE